jgi:hypothetical protein
MKGGFLEPALPLGYATLPSQLFFASLFLLFFYFPFPLISFFMISPFQFSLFFFILPPFPSLFLSNSFFALVSFSFVFSPRFHFHPFMFFITLSCLFYFIPPPFLNFLHANSLFSFSLTFFHSYSSSNNLSIHRSFFSFCCNLFSFLALSVISPFFLLSFLINSSTLSKSPLFCHNFLSSCHTSNYVHCFSTMAQKQ